MLNFNRLLKAKLLIFTTLFIICSGLYLRAQDPHFSQFYASPLNLNPAMTGTSLQGRFIFNYRAQWTKLPGEFATYQAGYDYYAQKLRSGFGFFANLDRAGAVGVRSVNLNFAYAYNLQLTSEWGIRGGFQLGYGNRGLDYYKLLFGDQLSDLGSTGLPTAEPNLGNLNVHYLDVGTGLVLYSANFWLGASALHLNRPNQSITDIQEPLPIKYAVQMGYKLVKQGLNKNKEDYKASFSPGIYYSRQGNYQQLDLGANGFLDPILLGVWYRAVPIQKSYNGAVVAMAGFKYQDWQFLYSYDFALGRFAQATGGAHEISLAINFVDEQTKKRYKRKRKKAPEFPSMVY
jgi:type IX secretion system PorP/SprF family membrane protein